jgi:hypothetical protein
MEDRVGVCIGVESYAIRTFALLATALNSHAIAYRDILDIFCNFCLSLFIAEDKSVVPRILSIKEHPAVPRVIGVFISLYPSLSNA